MASKKNIKRSRSTSHVDQSSKPKKKTSKDPKIQAIEHPIKDDYIQGTEFVTLETEALNGFKELARRLFKQCVDELPPDAIIKSPEAKSSINALKIILRQITPIQKKEIADSLEDLAWNMGCQLPVISFFSSDLGILDNRDNIDDVSVLEECKRGIIAFISEANRCLSLNLDNEETNKALKKHEEWYLNLYRKHQNADLLDKAILELSNKGILSKEDSEKFNNWSVQCLFFVTNEKSNKPESEQKKARYPWRERYEQKQKTLDLTPSPPLKVDEQQPMEREKMDENKQQLDVEFANATDPIGLGQIAKNARINAGLSQGKLEKASNISISTISRIETGKGTTPNLETLKDIAKATNTDLQIRFSPKKT